MNLSSLLGLKLKDDEVLEILEGFEIADVVYGFDRTHENIDDVYWAPAKASGFQFRFNKDQILDTVFCYIVADEGFSPISPDIIGATIYRTFDEAEADCRANGLSYTVSDPKWPKKWLRIDAPELRTHYQFKNGVLFRITLSEPPQ